MLEVAVWRRASDIHMQPQENAGDILFRIDGHLTSWSTITKSSFQAMIAKLKYIAHMDIGEKRLPQDGALLETIHGQVIQMRLSTLPTVFGEKLVVRLFPQHQKHLTLAHLGFTPQQFQLLNSMIHLPHGLLLVTGPTGSGKTTTLYKILEKLLQTKGKNIVSLEDPVEMRIPELTQVQISPQQGFTFAKGLRSILRQDPDIIFIGEIRDEETAEIAIRASLTGHFVLSTLHTPDCIGAVARLLEMNIKPYYVASALTGVVTQRLFRLSCPYCRTGCYACFYTGYLGRKGVFELLPVQSPLKSAIRAGGTEEDLRQVALDLHIPTIAQRMLRHYLIGLAKEEETYAFLTGDGLEK